MKLRFLIVFTLLHFCAYAQYNAFTRFRHYSTENGLAQSTVKFLVQDKQGFIWIATGDGLCRFDGKEFKVFKHSDKDSNSIAANTLEHLAIDKEGNLWISYFKMGLDKFNTTTFEVQHYRAKEGSDTGLWCDLIRKITQTDDGTIWVATAAGLNYMEKNSNIFKRIELSKNSEPDFNIDRNSVWALYPDGKNIWVGCYRSGGMFKIDVATKRKVHFKHDPQNTNSLVSDYVINFAKDKNGLLWISTRNGLSTYDELKNQFTNYTYDRLDPNSISSNDLWGDICVDSKNNVWIGTLNAGMNLFDRETGKFIRFYHDENYKHSLNHNGVHAIIEDRSGLLWIGTGNGLNVLSPYQQSFSALQSIPGNPQSLGGEQVVFVECDAEGKIWMGIDAQGIDIYDPKTKIFEHLRPEPGNLNSLPSNSVRDIAFGKDGLAYIVMHGIPAVVSYDPIKKIWKHLGGYWGKTIHADNEGKIWVGTSTGFGPLDSIDFYHQNLPEGWKLANPNVINISQNGKDHLWLIGGSNLADFDVRKKKIKNYELVDNLFCIHRDRNGEVWAGTAAGLVKFNDQMQIIKRYGTDFGFPNELISSITEDEKGLLWIGTNYGMVKFDPATEKFESFDYKDGLPNNEMNMGSMIRNGIIYISTVNGLLYFDPENIKRNKHIPPVVISSISVMNEVYKMSKEERESNTITFNHKQYFFTITFAALDFVQPEKNKYAYKLEGFNDDWVEIGNKNEVTFTNLSPGEYILRIKASNNHGVWNEEGVSLKIIVLPPWWQTTWFRVTMIISFLLIIFIIFKWRTAQLKRQKNILEKTVKERTSEVVQQKEIIEEKQKEIIDSITYAQRLQQAILTPEEEIRKYFPESFLLYKPKDIVAGDFYFFESTDGHVFYAAADCTGHGVPGAMVSIVCSNALTRCVYEFGLTSPEKILDKSRELIVDTFKKSSGRVQDGMDISLFVWNRKDGTFSWAGANNPLWIISDGKIIEVAADKQPIGTSYDPHPFTLQKITLKKGDSIFLFTDGYADQFGGPKGKKFKYSNLQKLLVENADKDLSLQSQILNLKFNDWKGDLEQVDDVCIIGIRI